MPGSRLRFGILAQALLPLALGTIAVSATATWLGWRQSIVQARASALRELDSAAQARSVRERPRFDHVAHAVGEVRRILHERLDKILATGALASATHAPWVPGRDGAIRILPTTDAPPLAAFVAAQASRDARQLTAARAAYDLLAELAPVLIQEPGQLLIAVPGAWCVGTGDRPVELAQTMLPDDPVLLAEERALVLAPPGPVRWTSAHHEPGTGTWLVSAIAAAQIAPDLAVGVIHVLPTRELLARASSFQPLGGRSVVLDGAGRVLAGPDAVPGSAGTANAPPMAVHPDPVLRQLAGLLRREGPDSELLADADEQHWFGISRLPGPNWVMATIHPSSEIARQVSDQARYLLIAGGLLLLGQAILLVAVLRARIAAPLRRLAEAARSLARAGAGEPPRHPELATTRDDEVGDLARAFDSMAEAVRARERELRSTLNALREREEHTRALVDSAADAVLLLVDGRIAEANTRASELFGLPLPELLGRSFSELSPEQQPDGTPSALAAQREAEAARGGAARHYAWRYCRGSGGAAARASVDSALPDGGSEFDAEIGLARVALAGPERLIAVVRDVSDRNRLEAQRRQGQKLESLGQLAGGIAHDFNNMLAGIMGAAELLERGGEDRERRSVLTATIRSAAQRAANLTSRLLSFARKGQPSRTTLDLHQIVRDAVVMLAPGLGPRVRIATALAARHPHIAGDASLLQNAILNLGINARDAMPSGGTLGLASADVELDAAAAAALPIPLPPGAYVRLEVSDTGTGIAPATMARLFEPFFTTKPVGQGTGLGLAAVYGTIREHGGSIEAENRSGSAAGMPVGGAIFRIWLPVLREDEHVLRRGDTGRTLALAAAPGSRGIALLADDEPVARTTGRMMLESLGFTVIEAVDGDDAVARQRDLSVPCTIAVLDMEMPGLRGDACLEALRHRDPGLHAVLCTGFVRGPAVGDPVLASTGAGFQARLAKPYRLHELSAAIDAALRDL